jgi:hypothetical protein
MMEKSGTAAFLICCRFFLKINDREITVGKRKARKTIAAFV